LDVFSAFLTDISTPVTIGMLIAGVLIGLLVGAIPGVGGLFGMALLLPLTNSLDIYASMGLLIGLGSVVTTSDTLPAILIGVPGTAAAIASVDDGHSLARQGQAGRALGASYSSSMLGGLFGALVLAVSIPILRPLVLTLRTPDFLAVSVLGLLFVAAVSGKAPLKGLLSALLGILVSMVGLDSLSGAQRFTLGNVYFWDGLSLTIVFVGLFGLAELVELLRRGTLADLSVGQGTSRVLDGIRDTLREWRLVFGSGAVGTIIGTIPGVGVTTIDWIVYGIATRNRKGGPPYGEGNIRGVIAPESANNAKEGGNLIPTLALGLPGSVSMAFVLATLSSHGIAPGPKLLNENLSLVYAIVVFIAVANVVGTAVCLVLTRPLARLAWAPVGYLVPIALVFVVLGAFREHLSLLDIACLVVFGGLGLLMKTNGWPRAAFAIGFILGPNIERYYFLSSQLTGNEWLERPTVLAVLAIIAFLAYRAWRRRKEILGSVVRSAVSLPDRAFLLGLLALGVWFFVSSRFLHYAPALFPSIVSSLLVAVAGGYLAAGYRQPVVGLANTRYLGPFARVVILICVLVALIYLLGPAVGAGIFALGSIAWLARPRLVPLLIAAVSSGVASYLLFQVFQQVSWPRGLLGLG